MKAIVDEHNRIRTKPAEYAAELKRDRTALVDSRVKGGELKTTAEKAIDAAIKDIDDIVAEKIPIAPLACSDPGSKFAKKSVDTKKGPKQRPQGRLWCGPTPRAVLAWHSS